MSQPSAITEAYIGSMHGQATNQSTLKKKMTGDLGGSCLEKVGILGGAEIRGGGTFNSSVMSSTVTGMNLAPQYFFKTQKVNVPIPP